MAEPIVIPTPSEAHGFVGRELGPSEWVRIAQERIDAFAEVTGDRQWIHCDVERARRESPWKSTVAHGYLSLSLVPALLSSVVEIRGAAHAVNSGLDKLRLSAPVPVGSRVRLWAEIKDVRALPHGGARISFAVRLEIEGSKKPALLASVNYAYFS